MRDKMKSWIIVLLFILSIVCVSPVMASINQATWTSNNDVVLNINNGQTAEFEYRVHAISTRGGQYNITLYKQGLTNPIFTYIPTTATVGNGANGYINVTPTQYGNTNGTYYVYIKSVDGFSSDSFRLILNVLPTAVSTFAVSCNAVPTNGYAPLNVDFTGTVTGGNAPYTYNWNYNDGSSIFSVSTNSLTNTQTHTYNIGTFNPTLRVVDSNSVSVTANCGVGAITVVPPTLSIQSINCFPRVVNNNNQSCSVMVTSSNGLVPGNVDVKIAYSDGRLFGTCKTNTLSGGCTVTSPVSGVGTYTVYATASAPGYINYTGNGASYTFDVYAQRYNVINLATYNDSNFFYPDNTFYRGESLYAKFQVYDPISNTFVTSDIVTAAALVSLPGGRVDLSRLSYNGNWYYYKLDMIPLRHEFLGDSNVFAFAFNFTGLTGGQAQVNLIILNNKPTISNIPDVYINVGQTSYIGLNSYGHDLEDNTLRWSITNNPFRITTVINSGNVLAITGNNLGDDIIDLRASDLDNDYSTTRINVHVITGIVNNTNATFTVACTASPTNGNIPLSVSMNALVNGGTAPYNYIWSFGDGGVSSNTLNSVTHIYNNVGTFSSSVTVTDANNNVVLANCGIVRTTSNGTTNQTLIFDMGGPYNGYVNQPVTFDASKSTGQIVRYLWNFGDGKTADTTTPTIQHTYTAINVYTVTLTIYYANGSINSGRTTATILDGSSMPKPVVIIDKSKGGLLITHLLIYGMDGYDILKPNDDLTVNVEVKNEYGSKLKNSRVVVSIPELGIEGRSTSFDLNRGGTQAETVTIPLYSITPGTYYVKISVGNDEVRRIKYRELVIKK
jgi:PKD repeat protein